MKTRGAIFFSSADIICAFDMFALRLGAFKAIHCQGNVNLENQKEHVCSTAAFFVLDSAVVESDVIFRWKKCHDELLLK